MKRAGKAFTSSLRCAQILFSKPILILFFNHLSILLVLHLQPKWWSFLNFDKGHLSVQELCFHNAIVFRRCVGAV